MKVRLIITDSKCKTVHCLIMDRYEQKCSMRNARMKAEFVSTEKFWKTDNFWFVDVIDGIF